MSILNDALQYAMEQHAGQYRKGMHIPYILHPMEAATIVASMTEDEETIAASVLHDVVEDTDATIEDIERQFGSRIASLVMSETENKYEDRPAETTWKQRKEETLQILRRTDDPSVKMLWMGDKLSNMRSFYRIYRKQGEEFWKGFHQKNPKIQEWYYRKIAEYLSDLKDYDAYQEYIRLVDAVFGE